MMDKIFSYIPVIFYALMSGHHVLAKKMIMIIVMIVIVTDNFTYLLEK